jgi:hypothetical protein
LAFHRPFRFPFHGPLDARRPFLPFLPLWRLFRRSRRVRHGRLRCGSLRRLAVTVESVGARILAVEPLAAFLHRALRTLGPFVDTIRAAVRPVLPHLAVLRRTLLLGTVILRTILPVAAVYALRAVAAVGTTPLIGVAVAVRIALRTVAVFRTMLLALVGTALRPVFTRTVVEGALRPVFSWPVVAVPALFTGSADIPSATLGAAVAVAVIALAGATLGTAFAAIAIRAVRPFRIAALRGGRTGRIIKTGLRFLAADGGGVAVAFIVALAVLALFALVELVAGEARARHARRLAGRRGLLLAVG